MMDILAEFGVESSPDQEDHLPGLKNIQKA
jgi:hypothetical protein